MFLFLPIKTVKRYQNNARWVRDCLMRSISWAVGRFPNKILPSNDAVSSQSEYQLSTPSPPHQLKTKTPIKSIDLKIEMIKLEFTFFSVGDAENPGTEAASKSNATKYRNRAIFQLNSISLDFNNQMRSRTLVVM